MPSPSMSRVRIGIGIPGATLLTAVMNLLFGTWALVVSGFNPVFSTFLVPGALLLLAAWPRAGDDLPPGS